MEAGEGHGGGGGRLSAAPNDPPSGDAVARFVASLTIDREAWHDGIGYDLGALRSATPEERARIEELLLGRGVRGWRDVEALAALGTPRAREALRRAATAGDHEVRLAVASHAPDVASDAERTASVVAALSPKSARRNSTARSPKRPLRP